jgi:nucleoside-diphosphate-sugar epimerase
VTTALVTGGSGLVGRALVARLRADGVRVLATARSYPSERAVIEAGAEPLHTDAEGLGGWAREIADVDVVYHLGLPRIEPPLRRAGARRRAKQAAAGAAALREAVGDRPVVMGSTGLLYGATEGPAVDDDPADGRLALAQAARRAEIQLEGPGLRVVRLPWVYGPTGLMRDLIVGLRTRRYRVVGPGDNPWSLLAVDDAASALVAAAAAPPGTYTAAEGDPPTQLDVIVAICQVPGHPRPDHAAPALAGIAMGGAMSEALAAPLSIRTGRLGALGWEPAGDWRRDLTRLAEAPLPLPRR